MNKPAILLHTREHGRSSSSRTPILSATTLELKRLRIASPVLGTHLQTFALEPSVAPHSATHALLARTGLSLASTSAPQSFEPSESSATLVRARCSTLNRLRIETSCVGQPSRSFESSAWSIAESHSIQPACNPLSATPAARTIDTQSIEPRTWLPSSSNTQKSILKRLRFVSPAHSRNPQSVEAHSLPITGSPRAILNRLRIGRGADSVIDIKPTRVGFIRLRIANQAGGNLHTYESSVFKGTGAWKVPLILKRLRMVPLLVAQHLSTQVTMVVRWHILMPAQPGFLNRPPRASGGWPPVSRPSIRTRISPNPASERGSAFLGPQK